MPEREPTDDKGQVLQDLGKGHFRKANHYRAQMSNLTSKWLISISFNYSLSFMRKIHRHQTHKRCKETMSIRESVDVGLGKYSRFLLLMKFQIKATLLYYFTPNRFVEQNPKS